jgi:hypothetical protein
MRRRFCVGGGKRKDCVNAASQNFLAHPFASRELPGVRKVASFAELKDGVDEVGRVVEGVVRDGAHAASESEGLPVGGQELRASAEGNGVVGIEVEVQVETPHGYCEESSEARVSEVAVEGVDVAESEVAE